MTEITRCKSLLRFTKSYGLVAVLRFIEVYGPLDVRSPEDGAVKVCISEVDPIKNRPDKLRDGKVGADKLRSGEISLIHINATGVGSGKVGVS